MSRLTTPIDSLPNEILIAILSTIQSRQLLSLTLVNRRFHATTTTILQRRLLQTANMQGHEIVLESYPPIARLTSPSISCRFMGVDFLDRTWAGNEDLDLRDLPQLYSRFRPVVSGETRRMRRMYTRPMPRAPAPPEDTGDDEPVTQEICFDEGERFSQICSTTSLVKTGPRPGIFASHRNIQDCVVRVRRLWLERLAAKGAIAPVGEQQRDESTILWTDANKNVGLRFRVTEIAQEQAPVLQSRDDDPPVAYLVRYEELLVRTSQVLLAMEKSAKQEIFDSGKAIVIASS